MELQHGFVQGWQKHCDSWIFPSQAIYLFWTQINIQSLGKYFFSFFNSHWTRPFILPFFQSSCRITRCKCDVCSIYLCAFLCLSPVLQLNVNVSFKSSVSRCDAKTAQVNLLLLWNQDEKKTTAFHKNKFRA